MERPMMCQSRYLVLFFFVASRCCATTHAFQSVKATAYNHGSTLFASTMDGPTQLKSRYDFPDTPQERADQAKNLWQTIATAKIVEQQHKLIDLQQSNDNYNNDNAESSSVQIFHSHDTAWRDFLRLKGTFYINGLSSCKLENGFLLHPFEAHGYLKSLVLDSGKLHFRTAVINTPITKWERKLQRPLARGVMNTLPNPVLNVISPSTRNTANLVATLWPLRDGNDNANDNMTQLLIVGGDNAIPYCCDPVTLQTLGPLADHLPSHATELKQILRNNKFLAHTRIDTKRNRLVMLASKFDIPGDGNGNTVLEFIEVDTNWNVVARQLHRNRFMVVHDWIMSDDYYILPLNPAQIKWNKLLQFALLGSIAGVEIFEMNEEEKSGIVVIPRLQNVQDNGKYYQFEADSHFSIFHFGPCVQGQLSETNNNDHITNNVMTVYASIFDRYQYGGEMGFDRVHQEFDPIAWSNRPDIPAPRLDRFLLNLSDTDNAKIIERERIPVLDKLSNQDIPVDMPTFPTLDSRLAFFSGAYRAEGWFPFHSVVKTDLLTKETSNWDAGPYQMISEVQFVPKRTSKNENDGFVLSIVHEASPERHECALLVWDALNFDAGPMARISLGELMPWCVHGVWIPDHVAVE